MKSRIVVVLVFGLLSSFSVGAQVNSQRKPVQSTSHVKNAVKPEPQPTSETEPVPISVPVSKPKKDLPDSFVVAAMETVNAISSMGAPLADQRADEALVHVRTMSDLELDPVVRANEKAAYQKLVSLQMDRGFMKQRIHIEELKIVTAGYQSVDRVAAAGAAAQAVSKTIWDYYNSCVDDVKEQLRHGTLKTLASSCDEASKP